MQDSADSYTAPLDVEAPILLRFSSAFYDYSVALHRDLFGDLVLMQSWGGKYTGRGGGGTRVVENFAAGEKQLQKIMKVRERLGYTLLNSAVAA